MVKRLQHIDNKAGNLSNYYTYSYDNLNRLTAGNANTGNNENNISYDALGNITGLSRSGIASHNLTYGYAGNQLTTVNNNGAGFRSYGYDADGNATSDGQGHGIGYNMLDLPGNIASLNLAYTYDVTGDKLNKTVGSNSTDYVDGIQYDNGAITFVQTEEGRAINSGGNYIYEYTLADHLGNSRVSFDQNAITIAKQQDSYYPFGLLVEAATTSPPNKYLYNGKELQEELGVYDYGWRQYDPVIGRFTTVDPKADLSRGFSPFAYGDDNAIRNIDPDGMETEDANDEGGDGDQKGIIRNASEGFKLQHPVRAAIVDGIHGILEGFGINAIDDQISDMSSKKPTTIGDKATLGMTILGAILAAPAEGGEGGELGSQKTYQTYFKDSKIGSEPPYSGRTSGTKTPEENIAARDANHHMSKDYGPARLDKSSKNADAIRGREQQNIDKHGGAKSQNGTSGNQRNSVSPKNPKKNHYKNEANNEFGSS